MSNPAGGTAEPFDFFLPFDKDISPLHIKVFVLFIFMLNPSYILSVISMYLSKALSKPLIIIKTALIAAVCGAVLFFSKECSSGIREGIELCMSVLVPSLFPFMVVSSLIVKSGTAIIIGKRLERFTKAVFGLPGCMAPVILLSMIGGYPVGAKGINELVKIGAVSKHQGKQAALFAVCAGPGFLISFVGASILGNMLFGTIILCSQCLSVIITGILSRLFFIGRDNSDNPEVYESSASPPGSALIEAVSDGTKSMLMICSFVLIFSSIIGVIDVYTKNEIIKSLLLSVLEVSTAVSKLGKTMPVELVAFVVGFGGICVHLQIFSVLCDTDISKGLFFIFRIFQGILTSLFTHIYLRFFPISIEVFSTSQVSSSSFFGGTVISAFALITVAICFLFSLRENNNAK